MTKVERAAKIAKKLKTEFPQIQTALDHSTAHELLFAVMLSAQSTDAGVNKITPALFARYQTIEDYANADMNELTALVAKVNYYKTKAKNIQAVAKMLIGKFNGEVPSTIEELTQLPGVGRKTANVILGQWFRKNEGFVVDTHVLRTAYRTRLTDYKDPKDAPKVEQELMQLFPQTDWFGVSLRMILHGRSTCPARRKPGESCSLGELCDRLD